MGEQWSVRGGGAALATRAVRGSGCSGSGQFGGASIPSEVMNSLAILQHLCITGCAQLTYLQGLNHLSCLRSLEINQCPNLTALQEDEKVQVVDAIYISDIPSATTVVKRSLALYFTGQKELREEDRRRRNPAATVCFSNVPQVHRVLQEQISRHFGEPKVPPGIWFKILQYPVTSNSARISTGSYIQYLRQFVREDLPNGWTSKLPKDCPCP
uniref:Uncharacterized protein n=1 Tax=Oryza punctata TaxID=4537 RepID=A0A0E0KM60_ORYPU